MESKNVIAAISLSAAVIILYTLFFAPSSEELKLQKIKQEKLEKLLILLAWIKMKILLNLREKMLY